MTETRQPGVSRSDAIDKGAPRDAQAVEAQHLSIRRLMWRRFRRNRVALVSAVILILMYIVITFAGFFSPYAHNRANDLFPMAPPQPVRFFDESGKFYFQPFVYPIESRRDPKTLRFVYDTDTTRQNKISLLVRGDTYRLFFWETDLHLLGVEAGTMFLLGTDARGRDMLSRIIYGARVTLSVGLIGVALVVFLGSTIGAVSGYFGGFVDTVIQRIVEVFRLFPPIPLWMALAAAMPPDWPSTNVLFGIIVIYGFIMWPGLAREVRGMTLVLRESEFVLSAKASGASTTRIVRKHLIPNVAAHLLVTATLGIPVVIIFESTLSFFGLGIKPPMTSWGLLLQQSQKLEVLSFFPWMLAPGAFIVVAVLLFNFVGDGIRDAVDPFS